MGSIFQSNPVNYFAPIPEEITLMAGKPNSGTGALDDELCEDVKNCGFNAIGATIGIANVASSLKNCANHGLKLFLHNYSTYLKSGEFIDEYKNRDGLGGWIMEFLASYNKLQTKTANAGYLPIAEANNLLIEKELVSSDSKDIKHPVFIGIGGDWNRDINYVPFGSQNPAVYFPDLIKFYQDTFHHSMWPIGYLPDLSPVNTSQIPVERQKMYYKTLQYMAYISRYTATPFWMYVRCQGLKGYYNMQGASPTLNMLRGLVFTSLAYGAQGIYYWNYRQDPSSSTGNPTYFDAPIDPAGQKTQTWNMVKTINGEVKAFNKVFCGCEMIDCRHLSSIIDDNNAENMRMMEKPMGPLMSIAKTDGSKPDVLVSHINNSGTDYLVIIANPFELNVNKTQKLVLHFSSYWHITRPQIVGANFVWQILTNYDYPVTLSPGDYIIFRWE